MSLVVVGSVALDTVRTPFGNVEEAIGGAATYFSVAASYFTGVAVVAVVGNDFPAEGYEIFTCRGIDTSGLVVENGETFRWVGEYGYDLNERETIDTRLNVFEGFNPVLSGDLASSDFVFLANIDPELQRSVLGQVSSPRLTALDTMNFWIEKKHRELLDTISGIDVIVMNDAECRELAEEPNLIKASRVVQEMGPQTVVVKKGEHGALMLTGDEFFIAPAFPCESVFDPTGAGDSFAGGFMGYLASTGDISAGNMRKAIIYGTVMASFCVEQFSISGLEDLTVGDIEGRYRDLRTLSSFEA